MTLKLYYSPGACSLASHITLEESLLPYSAVLASTKTHKLPDGTDFYTINPLGYVPVLELADGSRLREGPAILQYIADQVPGKQLAPANGTMARYHLQEWLTFIGTEVHKSFAPLFTPGAPEPLKEAARSRIGARLTWLNGEIGGKPYLMGEHFTVADAYLFTVCRWAAPTGVDVSSLGPLLALCERVGQRPAAAAALKAEGLVKS